MTFRALSFISLATLTALFATLLPSPSGTPQQAKADTTGFASTVKIIAYKYTSNGYLLAFSQGSGTLTDSSGLVITNNHVVSESAEEDDAYDVFELCFTLTATGTPQCGYTASLVARDANLDVAILKAHSLPTNVVALPYKGNPKPGLNDALTLYSYPATGGETLTVTQGNVSGFVEADGIEYIKTDAYVDYGSSGGTAVNVTGQWVGIPTFKFSDLGYLLTIQEAEPWIDAHKNDAVQVNQAAKTALEHRLQFFKNVQTSKMFQPENYPRYKVDFIKAPTWSLEDMVGEVAILWNNEQNMNFTIQTQEYPFSLSDEYMQGLVDEYVGQFGGYELGESVVYETKVAGQKAWKIRTDIAMEVEEGLRLVHMMIPYGYSLVSFDYAIDLSEEEDQKEELRKLFEAFSWVDTPVNEVTRPSTFTSNDPDFWIERTGDWFIQPGGTGGGFSHIGFDFMDQVVLAEFLRSDRASAKFSVIWMESLDASGDLTASENLERSIQNKQGFENFSVIAKSDDVVVDGLPGWAFAYTFTQGENEMKSFELYAPYDEDNWLYFDYTDTFDGYSESLPEVMEMLKTFRQQSTLYPRTGEFKLIGLNRVFKDLDNHRYEGGILNLFNRGLVRGYTNGMFKPENKVSRAEALKISLTARLEESYDGDRDAIKALLEDYVDDRYNVYDFTDTAGAWYTKYVRYAKLNEFIVGYPDSDSPVAGARKFAPHQTVTTAEALSLLFKMNNVEYWTGNSGRVVVNWRKPLMNKAFELGIVPRGLEDGNLALSRGEFSEVVSRFLEGRE